LHLPTTVVGVVGQFVEIVDSLAVLVNAGVFVGCQGGDVLGEIQPLDREPVMNEPVVADEEIEIEKEGVGGGGPTTCFNCCVFVTPSSESPDSDGIIYRSLCRAIECQSRVQ
jgi:hypothetical protein